MSKRPKKSASADSKSGKSDRLKNLPATRKASAQVTGGKRSVVKDSHDRHANIDVNF
jgi:hypothetical protein